MRARWSKVLGRGAVRAIAAVAAMLLVLVVALLPSPYAVELPGPVYDTLGSSGTGKDRAPLISIPDETTYPTRGRLDLLTVSVVGSASGGPSWLELARAWLSPTQSVIPLEAVFPPGTTTEQAQQQSAAQMSESQQSAIAAALTELGYDVEGDVRVVTVTPGTAADGALRAGDLLRSYDGTAVRDACALDDDVVAGGTRPTDVVVERDGTERTLRLTPKAAALRGGGTRPRLGVAVTSTYRFPIDVDLTIDRVGGPSAGMMFALGIIDKLTPGALTGGRHVAGTGTICGDGEVGAIGGIVEKMAAARAAGATLFLAPEGNCDEVVGHVPAGLRVAAVGTLSDSLSVLEDVRADGSAARLPTCEAQVESSG